MSTSPVTIQFLEAVLSGFRDTVVKRLSADAGRVSALEARIAKLEGTLPEYEPQKVYAEGDRVRFDGADYRALRKTARQPGDGSAWALQ